MTSARKPMTSAEMLTRLLRPATKQPAAGKALLGSAGRLAARIGSESDEDDDLSAGTVPRPWDDPMWGRSTRDEEPRTPPAKPKTPPVKPRPQTSAERVERLLRQPRKRT